MESATNELALQWFMGGYNRDYSGRPQDGWYFNNLRGGNNVKAYPRIAIGTASGQQYASWGSPNTPVTQTNGMNHVDYDTIQQNVGIPARYNQAPNIDLNVDLRFSMGSDEVSPVNKYGSFFFAVDSYFHDIDTPEFQLDPSMAGTMNGMTDSSGVIFGRNMGQRAASSKRWAMMIWYAKSTYFENSGGVELARDVLIGGIPHIVKYKMEDASDLNFHYAAFIMDKEVNELTSSTVQPRIRFNDYADFFTNGSYQVLLENYMNNNGLLPDIDGVPRRIQAPTPNFVLSDINLGVEILANPDTPQNQAQHPVRINFKKLSFDVEGKGSFGFDTERPFVQRKLASTPCE